MFSVMCLSLGTYVVKPFFPTCVDPPEGPVKMFTALAMCKYHAYLSGPVVRVYSVITIRIYQALWLWYIQ